MKDIIIFILIIILIFLILSNISNFENVNDDAFNKYISQFKFYDENNKVIDHFKFETDEQKQAYLFIEPYDVVLELGARYGTVSVVVNSLLTNKENHVVVEPDSNVIKALTHNRDINNCHFQILNKYISNKGKKIEYDGYSTKIVDSNNTNDDLRISYEDFKTNYQLNFNVLIADCEGCLYEFLLMMGDDLDKYKKIIYEEDQPQICNYDAIKKLLENKGFVLRDERFNDVNRYVYIK